MNNLSSVQTKISPERKRLLMGQHPCIIWFTGLSGSGKSTLAVHLEVELFNKGYKTLILDGDNVRLGFNSDLGFSEEDRVENIRRISEVAKLFLDAGIIVLAAFISPFRSNRELVRSTVGVDRFIEVFVDAPIEMCEQRDTKGLYKKARAGQLRNFTGIDSPYERPECPSVLIEIANVDIEEAVSILLSTVENKIKLI